MGKKKAAPKTSKKNAASAKPARNNKGGKKHQKLKGSRGGDDDYQLRQSIEEDGTKAVVDIDADGNCLFRALSDQLYLDRGHDHHVEIRHDICNYLEAYEADFAVFLVLEDNETDDDGAVDFATYVHNMRQDGAWGGNVELVAAARLYRRNITVFSPNMAAYTVSHDDSNTSSSSGPDLLVSYHDNDHYNSVRDSSITIGKLPLVVKTFVKCSELDHDHNNPDDNGTARNVINNSPPYTDNVVGAITAALELEGTEPSSTNDAIVRSRPVPKKGAPCPCGSGVKYKTCCGARQKKRKMRSVLAMMSQSNDADEASSEGNKMAENFGVLKL